MYGDSDVVVAWPDTAMIDEIGTPTSTISLMAVRLKSISVSSSGKSLASMMAVPILLSPVNV